MFWVKEIRWDLVHKWRDWLQNIYLATGRKDMGTGIGGCVEEVWQFSSDACFLSDVGR